MAYLDYKDKLILEHLFQDGRLTTKKLAQLAGITQPAAYHRLRRLEEEKFIDRYDAIVNYQLVNLTKKSYLCNLDNQKVSKIKKLPECVLLLKCIGVYTHHLTCWFKTKTQQKNFEKLLPKNREEYELQKVFTKGPSLFDIPLKHQFKQYPEKQLKLTKEDVAIIKAVCEGGARKTLMELSNKTGLSIDVIHYRKKRLTNNGYFSYFIAQPGFGKMHLTVSYIYIKTGKKKIPLIPRSPLAAITNDGVMIAFLSKDLDDFSKTADKIFSFYRKEIKQSQVIINKGYLVLNRYPFEYLLQK